MQHNPVGHTNLSKVGIRFSSISKFSIDQEIDFFLSLDTSF